MVITSVGSPEPVMKPLKDAGCLVLADVASVRHAEKAVAAGVDGLVLLTAGAGGQTGWVNPFAFVRAVRSFWDGIVVMAGGMADGQAIAAAETLGCDLAYMGTKFIATRESLAKDAYKADAGRSSRLDDVMLTRAFTGLETNMLRPSIAAAGLDPDNLPERGDDRHRQGHQRRRARAARTPNAGRTSGAPATRSRAWPTCRRSPSWSSGRRRNTPRLLRLDLRELDVLGPQRRARASRRRRTWRCPSRAAAG